MVSWVHTVAFQGIEVLNVDVQVQLSSGLPSFQIVGLADKAVAESRERIRASFHSLNLSLPCERITVNLSPADLQKEGSHYDLPVALGILAAMGLVDQEELSNYCVLGELNLDGSLSKVPGVLAAAMSAYRKDQGLICPASCGQEAAWSGLDSLLAAPSLLALLNHFKGQQLLSPPTPQRPLSSPLPSRNLQDIKGQTLAKRALEIAAAGGHNLLLMGPPGAGKSLLASCLPSLLPPLEPQEMLEVSTIHSLAGLLPEEGLVQQRPYRAPHHSASLAALVGGGLRSKPGEISLAHRGVLFLDELPEFARPALEALRQPLESGTITVARANAHLTYPARIQLIAAMNPCRCGYFGDPEQACQRAPTCAQDYQKKISGPLLDRFDLVLSVPALKVQELIQSSQKGEDSYTLAQRIASTRILQRERYKNHAFLLNCEADGQLLQTVACLDQASEKLLQSAVDTFRLSARGYHRILRVARTIADLEECESLRSHHVAEAIHYRTLTKAQAA